MSSSGRGLSSYPGQDIFLTCNSTVHKMKAITPTFLVRCLVLLYKRQQCCYLTCIHSGSKKRKTNTIGSIYHSLPNMEEMQQQKLCNLKINLKNFVHSPIKNFVPNFFSAGALTGFRAHLVDFGAYLENPDPSKVNFCLPGELEVLLKTCCGQNRVGDQSLMDRMLHEWPVRPL